MKEKQKNRKKIAVACPNCFSSKVVTIALCLECKEEFPLEVINLIKKLSKKIKWGYWEELSRELRQSENLKEVIGVLKNADKQGTLCPACHHQIGKNVKFCPQCGSSLKLNSINSVEGDQENANSF